MQFELVRTPVGGREAPDLDADQRAVVDHPGGPLLVLAGPGTGKTTTLVEAVVDRITGRGSRGDRIVVLTFSRKAAVDLRQRITARLGRAVVTPQVSTFHAFCYALLQRFGLRSGLPGSGPESYQVMPRLLTAPEQEFRVREVLAGTAEEERDDWPGSVARAFGTRGFATEVRAVIAKARQLGLDPEDLVEVGESADRPEWVSVGRFFDEYLDVLDAEQVLDYGELVHRCRILLADPEVVATLRSEIDAVFVDEYQDTDPAQVNLLAALAGDGRDLVVVGDPDQSIYAFRGAEARGILDFPDRFPRVDQTPARVLALGRTRRFGPRLLAASRGIVGRLGLPRSLPPEVRDKFRNPVCTSGTEPRSRDRGKVEVLTYASVGAEAEHVAELLRRAHLDDGLAWSRMAVLVRSGRRSLPGLCRALVAAGVPVEVAGDEIALSAELAVRPILLALRAASEGRRVIPDDARTLLMSPLGGLDGLGVRRLGRVLRQSERDELAGTALPRLSDELLAAALHDPGLLQECPDTAEVVAARTVARLLAEVETLIAAGGSAEEALWTVWSATSWPDRMRRTALGLDGSPRDAARRASRDLDAVCALFDIAARAEDLGGRRGVLGLLTEVEAQEIPADTRTEGDLAGTGVRVLTAHRSKGLEWELVVVASVQEGVWPDLRRRGSLLEADRLDRLGPGRVGWGEVEPTAARVAEERRLFYVACTRARSRLVVTAVEGTEGEGDQPSRFLTELGVTITPVRGRPRRPASLSGLVGELRATAVDPAAAPALRHAAAVRLARLADATDRAGRPLVPAADPDRWWGMRLPSAAEVPVVGADEPVHLSGSQLSSVLACPRQWFLARKAYGERLRGSAATFGSVIHVLAEHAAGLPSEPEQWAEHLAAVWDSLDFDAKWLSGVERAEAEAALERFAAWQHARPQQELLGVEVSFATEVEAGGQRIRLTGVADRVERDPDGRIRIVDFKTGRSQPSGRDVAQLEQLGVYQLAVQTGAFAEVTGDDRATAGAELVYLRHDDSGLPKTFWQASLDDQPFPTEVDVEPAPGVPSWVHGRLAQAATIIREERFDATVNPGCRWCPFRSSCPAQSAGRQVVA
ncbi:MAG: ATP-dependent helicase [Propionibacteriaceae bacterium]